MSKIKTSIFDTLLKNSSLSMIGSILIRGVDLISIPVFTRLLDTAEYGRFSVFTTYVQIFTILMGLDLHACLGNASLEFKQEKERFYSVTIILSMMWSSFVIVMLNVFHGVTEKLLSMNQLEFNILLVYAYASFLIHYKSTEYIFFFKYKQNIVMSLCMALGNLGLSVFFVMTFFSDNRFLGKILGAAIPSVCIAIMIACTFIHKGKALWNKTYSRYALKYGIPLIPHNLSHLILSNSDRIMIQSMVGDSESGIYSLTYSIGLMMHVITEGANNVWSPMLFRRLEEGKGTLIRQQARIYLLCYTCAAVGIITISPEIVKIISARSYWDGIDLVMWICLSTYLIFVYQLYVNVEFYYKKTALISMGTLGAAVINIVLNLFGIPIYGYGFAAVSTLISYACLTLFHCMVLNFIIRDRVIDDAFTLIMAGIVTASTFVLHTLRHQYLYRYMTLVIIECFLLMLLIHQWNKYKTDIKN